MFDSPPDSYTLLFTQPAPLVVNQALNDKLPFEPEKFRVPVVVFTSPRRGIGLALARL